MRAFYAAEISRDLDANREPDAFAMAAFQRYDSELTHARA
jgi:hypothetical protein